MVETKGKKGRKVPVLLTPDMKEAIDLLIATRDAVGISQENPYVFARVYKQSDGHMRAWDTLRKLTDEVSLQHPEALTSTKLRKYVSTVTQVLNLQESEVDWLARHMGHDLSVHREFYRLHESTVELAKVGSLLIAVDQGKVRKYAGKELNDISINGE